MWWNAPAPLQSSRHSTATQGPIHPSDSISTTVVAESGTQAFAVFILCLLTLTDVSPADCARRASSITTKRRHVTPTSHLRRAHIECTRRKQKQPRNTTKSNAPSLSLQGSASMAPFLSHPNRSSARISKTPLRRKGFATTQPPARLPSRLLGRNSSTLFLARAAASNDKHAELSHNEDFLVSALRRVLQISFPKCNGSRKSVSPARWLSNFSSSGSWVNWGAAVLHTDRQFVPVRLAAHPPQHSSRPLVLWRQPDWVHGDAESEWGRPFKFFLSLEHSNLPPPPSKAETGFASYFPVISIRAPPPLAHPPVQHQKARRLLLNSAETRELITQWKSRRLKTRAQQLELPFLRGPLIQGVVELQPIARAHQIGQRQPPTVYIYMAADTMEENVYKIIIRKHLEHMAEREKQEGSRLRPAMPPHFGSPARPLKPSSGLWEEGGEGGRMGTTQMRMIQAAPAAHMARQKQQTAPPRATGTCWTTSQSRGITTSSGAGISM
ncbi:hypothetical protein BKA81DRAFT_402216 [Phyllosticta paracitricarpa]